MHCVFASPFFSRSYVVYFSLSAEWFILIFCCIFPFFCFCDCNSYYFSVSIRYYPGSNTHEEKELYFISYQLSWIWSIRAQTEQKKAERENWLLWTNWHCLIRRYRTYFSYLMHTHSAKSLESNTHTCTTAQVYINKTKRLCFRFNKNNFQLTAGICFALFFAFDIDWRSLTITLRWAKAKRRKRKTAREEKKKRKLFGNYIISEEVIMECWATVHSGECQWK